MNFVHEKRALLLWLFMALMLAACKGNTQDESFGVTQTEAGPVEKLLVYAGAASKPPTEDAVMAYEKKTGVKVDVIFGGSGYVLSQMKLAKEGDLYFPGSSDYMEKAKRDGDVLADTEKVIVYLVPAINVQKGNPHGIRTLKDLTKPARRNCEPRRGVPRGLCGRNH